MVEPPESRESSEPRESTREPTELLRAMCERGAFTDPHLDPIVYDEVRRLAHALMRKERGSHTLQTTALAHEAYARLIDSDRVLPSDKSHFLALVARAMRRILVDHARARRAAKRGGDWQRVVLDDVASDGSSAGLDLVALDEALSELARHDERKATIVELRFFAGMSVAEVAEAIGRSETAVRNEWYVARAWLKSRLA